MRDVERVETVIVGGGQAGLSVGYHLARRGRPCVILEANDRIGDGWRRRWDSLRLFSPAFLDGLDGLPFPAPRFAFPTKDEMADYLESYAAHFRLPVRTASRVDRLSRDGDGYVVAAGARTFHADHVVVAMANFQVPRVPAFARELDPAIVQLHSSAYRNPSQLRDGAVLVVGAGNSGAEIAMDLARAGRAVTVAGRDTGRIPFRIDGALGRLVLVRLTNRVVFHRVLTRDTPIGRRARPKIMASAAPLIRVKPEDLAAAGVVRAPRVAGVRDGRPLLDDGRTVDVPNVIWCTGYDPGFSWIDLPVLGADGEPSHDRGVVPDEPGLYFVGLHFLYAMSSAMVHGVGRDADHVAATIASRAGRAGGVTAPPGALPSAPALTRA